MDPISLGVLAALAGGAGGEVGKQCWRSLTALVRRPFQHAAAATVSSGEAELVALERDPENTELVGRLSTALAVRAALEPEFGPALERWHGEAQTALAGNVTNNTINDGTYYGTVLMTGTVNGGNHNHYHGAPPQE
ncbi:hypothetical protein AB0O31_28070 [Kitasatospora cineracea]|uniref:hypothetical protein n=1 Tax=Kitasatospora cineracea TaxID=88074 RepID=UPI00342DBA3A